MPEGTLSSTPQRHQVEAVGSEERAQAKGEGTIALAEQCDVSDPGEPQSGEHHRIGRWSAGPPLSGDRNGRQYRHQCRLG